MKKIIVFATCLFALSLIMVSCRSETEPLEVASGESGSESGGVPNTPVAKTLTSIAVTQNYTGDYILGDTITEADISVIATYSDGTSAPVTTWSTNEDFSVVATDKTIIISYTEDGVTKTAPITITIVAAYTVTYKFTTGVTQLPLGTDGTLGTTGTYVEFGDWPQTIKDSSVTIQERQKKDIGMFTYYAGSDGNWYCKAQENGLDYYGTIASYSNGEQVALKSSGSYKYFKVEPIKWRVLATDYTGADSTATPKKLLFAEVGLMANVPFYDNTDNRDINGTVYPNNYEHSKIRAWLNGTQYNNGTANNEHTNKGFLQTAFDAVALAKIKDVEIDNSEASTNPSNNPNMWNSGQNGYSCGNTTDKIFLLSAKEVTTANYGFDEYYNMYVGDSNGTTTSTRIRKPTDFALANYAYLSSTAGQGGIWWLRSPCCDYPNYGSKYADGSLYARDVDGSGKINS